MVKIENTVVKAAAKKNSVFCLSPGGICYSDTGSSRFSVAFVISADMQRMFLIRQTFWLGQLRVNLSLPV